jgi:hypothetical protein
MYIKYIDIYIYIYIYIIFYKKFLHCLVIMDILDMDR